MSDNANQGTKKKSYDSDTGNRTPSCRGTCFHLLKGGDVSRYTISDLMKAFFSFCIYKPKNIVHYFPEP